VWRGISGCSRSALTHVDFGWHSPRAAARFPPSARGSRHRPPGAGEIAGLPRDSDRADATLEPDPAGLQVGDLKAVLDPVLFHDRVDVDLMGMVGDVVEQVPEAVGARQIA